MSAKKVLIVDDDHDLVEANSLFLKAQGFEVATAHTAAEGLKVLETFTPDIITVDLMMEHHDSGFNFCRKVKDRPATAHTPVIMLTGVLRETGLDFSHRTKDERSWIKADEVLQKPVSPQQLYGIICRHIGMEPGKGH